MNIILILSATLSALFILVIVLLVFQIQNSLSNHEKQIDKLLRVIVEQANEINKSQIEASSNLNKQLENLIQKVQKIDNYLKELEQINTKSNLDLTNLIQETQKVGRCLSQLQDANHQDGEKLYNLLYGNTNIQLEKLQATVDELRALKFSLEESVKF
ncbi:hypothetical protein Nos7524_3944 [Nostoc sp. PCC 7524]|uniref:hypothetical protein n=1 Tax=Nostoc sp. (strain ATCC 29411 / PCC 7524) TaxID=28072 RepID=UPI00029EF113|nr:hypothetical protein [Nostoc sp. PCC 7524]AFY49717.1 hypothetical protein Nos7524_3944 [Nostoc sp. PCC 7524]